MGVNFVSSQGGVLPTYVFEGEEKDLFDWVETIARLCIIGAGKQVFGVSLAKAMNRKLNRHSIPTVVTQAVSFIDAYGLEQQGIFRISGLNSLIAKFKSDYDRGLSVTFDSSTDPHAVAGLLKMYLRELPEPLIPFKCYNDFVQFEVSDVVNRVEDFAKLATRIPQENYRVLCLLVEFLGRVEALHETNLMSVSNLALVFGPNILRPAGSGDQVSMRLVQDTPVVNKIMELFITERLRIFPQLGGRLRNPKSQSTGERALMSNVIGEVNKRASLGLELNSSFQRAAASRRGPSTSGFLSARGAPSVATQTPKYEPCFLSDDEESPVFDLPNSDNLYDEGEDETIEEEEVIETPSRPPRPVSGNLGRGPTAANSGMDRPASVIGARPTVSVRVSAAPPGRGNRRITRGVTKQQSVPSIVPQRAPPTRAPPPSARAPPQSQPQDPPSVEGRSGGVGGELTLQKLFRMLQEETNARKRLEARVQQLEQELARQNE